MHFWMVQSLNSLALGAVLFTLAAGFSLIFGLMRVANLSHGAYFMLGAYLGYSALQHGWSFGGALLLSAGVVGLLGVVVERFVLRRLAGNSLAQVLATLGVAFIVDDASLWLWGGDPQSVSPPHFLRGASSLGGLIFPTYRLAVIAFSVLLFAALWLLLERTRVGVMIRASVDDMAMARAVGIPAERLYTLVFFLGTALAGLGGTVAAPILSVYPGMDADMLPLALVVVILGGLGSLGGAFLGSVLIGFIYSFGQSWLPNLSYIILFLPMVIILAVRPRGLLGRISG